ncbi:MAG: TIM barrel protein [Verrucomicrobia bacterium]|nr:TIM barrel protein [Verrucomicrobiota bacterium]
METTPANSPCPIQIANAPCSWGALEFDLPGGAIGYAQVLDEIRETGYAGTELGDWGFMPTVPAELRRELVTRGLQLVGAFVPIAFARAEEAVCAEGEVRAVKTAQLMAEAAGDSPFLVLADDNGKDPQRTKLAGRIGTEHGLSSDQWRAYGERVNRVAAAVRGQAGLRTVFHHHGAGYVETPAEIEALLQHTDPGLVGLCFDTGHYRFGGGTASVEVLRRFHERIWHVHFKDCSPAVHERSQARGWDYFQSLRHGIFCELGRGDVPFPAILSTLREQGYRGWIVVEQDVLPGMGAPKQYAQANRDYLRRCGLGP